MVAAGITGPACGPGVALVALGAAHSDLEEEEEEEKEDDHDGSPP